MVEYGKWDKEQYAVAAIELGKPPSLCYFTLAAIHVTTGISLFISVDITKARWERRLG